MLRYRGRARPRVECILAASLATRDWLGMGCHGRPATLMHRCCMSCCKRCRGRCFGCGKGAANTNPWMSRRAAGQMFRTNSPRHAGMPRPLWGDWPLVDPLSAHHLQEAPPRVFEMPASAGSLCASSGLSSLQPSAAIFFHRRRPSASVGDIAIWRTGCRPYFLNTPTTCCPPPFFLPRTCQIAPSSPIPGLVTRHPPSTLL
jgi:hypothetical protein